MKIYEKRTRPESQYDALIKRSCDLCSRTTKTEDWSNNCYDIDETEISIKIKQKEGSNYPDGGGGTEYEIDLCPDCFKNKLVPWLQAQNPNVKEKEWNW